MHGRMSSPARSWRWEGPLEDVNRFDMGSIYASLAAIETPPASTVLR